MLIVSLTSAVIKDTQDYGYREGDLRLTAHFQHNGKEIKCIILPSTKTDGESFENYYDGEPVFFAEGIGEQITDHLSDKMIEGFFDDKPIGYEYCFEL
jgi:hypothetical protein